MNIKNLSVGQEIKNYKMLCEILEEKVKGGDSKKAQLKEFERYCKYHKDKNKFIIDEIYKEPLPKKTTDIEYIKIIELLILDKLAQSGNEGKIYLSKNKLLLALKMISKNYTFCKYGYRVNKLSQYIDINQNTIEEFYESADGTLKGNINKALNNLKNRSLIFWNIKTTIGFLNTENINEFEKEIKIDKNYEEVINYKLKDPQYLPHREATEEEEKYIIRVERDVLLQLHCDSKQDLIIRGLYNEFRKRVGKIILEERNITTYYESYNILFNTDQIMQGYISFLEFLLKDTERNKQYNLLNTGVAKRLLHNAINRNKNANKKLNEEECNIHNKETFERRISEAYIDENNKLIEILINKNAQDIRNDIKNQKL